MKISVIGAGTWGTALGRVLALNGNEVCIWSCFPEEAEELSDPNYGIEPEEDTPDDE